MKHATPRRLLTAVLLLACWPGLAAAQDAPAPPVEPATEAQPEETPDAPAPGLHVRDLAIMQADLYGQAMNDPGDFRSTLFNGAPRRRRPADAGTVLGPPMPLGVITFSGSIDRPTSVRLELGDATGRFMGHWPKAVAGRTFLGWYDIAQVPTPEGRARIDADHWLAPLRDNPDTLPFNTRGHVDRFLAYDATFPFKPPLTVEGSADEGYRFAGESPAGTELALIVRRDGDAWRVGQRDPAALTSAVEMKPVENEDAALAPVLDALRERGYTDAEVATAAAILRESAMGDAAMSLIVVLGRDAMDTALPLTVMPAPASVTRVGIVVVNNVEPDIAGTVGTLIAQLGSDRWSQRDAAQRALVEMDRAAIMLVRQNVDHADPEVAYRVEQIIAAFDAKHGEE